MIHRIQNILIVVWGLLALLLLAFNWSRLWRPEPMKLLFMEFDLPWLAWLLIGSVGLVMTVRALGWIEVSATRRRMERALVLFKAQAFDERGAEIEKLATSVQEKLEASLKPLIASQSELLPGAEAGEPEK